MSKMIKAMMMATVGVGGFVAMPTWAQAQAGGGEARATPAASSAPTLNEIIVTAQKRTERLLDAAIPVAVITSEILQQTSQNSLSDYFKLVPGLSFNVLNRGENLIAIRGITTGGAGNPTVATVIDDVPFGASTSGGFGFIIPEVDPANLSDVQVLRGPQGTLYGASTLGGLIKYTTVSPSTEKAEGQVRVGTTAVAHGNKLGYNVSGALNVPLSSGLAVRVSGFTRRDPGYLDDPVTGAKDVNTRDVRGATAALLWEPSSDFSLKLSALTQKSDQNAADNETVRPGFTKFQQHQLIGTGYFKSNVDAYSGTIKANLGGVTLTSLTGYNKSRYFARADVPGRYPAALLLFGVNGSALPEVVDIKKFTQEVRFDIPISSAIDLVVGGFYTDEKTLVDQQLTANNPTTGASVGTMFYGLNTKKYEEYAGFANLTVHLTDQFQIEAGVRESKNKQNYVGRTKGVLIGLPNGPFNVSTPLDSKDSSFTYLFAPSYKISPDVMIYGRASSGYQPGFANAAVPTIPNVPPVKPARTYNYEVGAKGRILNGLVDFDASLYYIDWKSIQLTTLLNNFTVGVNGGAARSKGAELTLNYHPFERTTIGGWIVYNDAVLSEDFPAGSVLYGKDGDRLPYSSRVSANLSFDSEFDLPSDLTGFVGGTLAYVGSRRGMLQATAVRQVYGAYAEVSLRAGVTWNDWKVSFFANNLLDRRGVQAGGLGFADPTAFRFIQPRTMGVMVARKF